MSDAQNGFLIWTKAGRDWTGIWGGFRAKVNEAGPIGLCHWSIYKGAKWIGAGATSSIVASKRAAERALVDFTERRRADSRSV